MNILLISKGFKRLIAGLLAAVTAAVTVNPQLAFLAPYISYIATFFGITGLAVATYKGTLTKFKVPSLAAAFQVLLEVAKTIPSLLPFVPLLQMIAALFGVTALAISKPVTASKLS